MIRWTQRPTPLDCRVCGWSGEGSRIAEVPSGFGTDEIRVVRCPRCRSLRLADRAREFGASDSAVDAYVESGAGIDTLAELLDYVDPATVRRVLDVGCNYGFALDLGRFLYGWEVQGVEPSLAGRRGAADLELDIRDEYLTGSSAVATDFDLVLASEILEHVVDPGELLGLLRARIGASGTLVLTTPAAEIVSSESAESDVMAAISPGDHVLLASRDGLEQLLRGAGFTSIEIELRHVSLRATACVGEAASAHPSRQAAGGGRASATERLPDYYAFRAEHSPRGSALASGMATRHLHALVSRGQFAEVEPSAERVIGVFADRGDVDLRDPSSALNTMASRGAVPPNLGSAAFSLGMLDLLHRGNPQRAAAYFELASAAIERWASSVRNLDAGSVVLDTQARFHRALALARFDPAAAAQAAADLAAHTGTSPAEVESVAARQTRVFVDLVARGHYAAAAGLEQVAVDKAPGFARSRNRDQRVVGLDGLFSLGIAALQAGDESQAHAWFDSCWRLCEARPSSDSHASGLAPHAKEHAERTAALAEPGRRPLPEPAPTTHHHVDAYWCDASGTFVEGWAFAENVRTRCISLEVGEHRTTVDPGTRADLEAFWPDIPEATASGFSAYVPGSPHGPVALVLHTEHGDHRIALSLPGRPLPALDEIETLQSSSGRIAELLAGAPDGPVVTIGMRSSSEVVLESRLAVFGDRRIVNVDIHPGIGVDVVGDAHGLSRFLANERFAIAATSSLLEHVSAPWLVAAELARVLKVGGIALHTAPWVFPTHSQPADYWRFSPEGLVQLFGPALGFEVLATGTTGGVTVSPTPEWRLDQLRLPTTTSASGSWIVSRKTSPSPSDVAWPYDQPAGSRLAQRYPVDGLIAAPVGWP